MKVRASVLLFLLLVSFSFASDFGIYEKVIENSATSPERIAEQLATNFTASKFTFLNKIEMKTPNIVREDTEKHSDFKAFLVLATCPAFDSLLINFGNRYAANWILRVGVYQDQNGTHVIIANPETITRIICNDLPDEDYKTLVAHSCKVTENLRKVILSAVEGNEVTVQMPPVRDEERLRKAKKDMMMMVGPMTFFKDEGQFLIPKEVAIGENPAETFNQMLAEVEQNIQNFRPDESDKDYHWCENPDENLLWRVVCKIKSPDRNAAILGITRGRTEALSFHIGGMTRDSEANQVPGIDHVAAYPIEVVVFEEDGKIKVGSPREMFRMDMFFWDAGKIAFMKYMNMPKMLDKSIQKAVAGQ